MAVQAVKAPAHSTQTLRRVDGNGFGGCERLTGRDRQAAVNFIETEENTDVTVREALYRCGETSSIDQVETPYLSGCLGRGRFHESEEGVVSMRRVSLCTAEAGLAILDFADHLVHLMRPVSLKATGGKQVFPSVTTLFP